MSRDQADISLGEALVVVSEVLESLHDANVRLQDRIGPTLGVHGTDLIEDLQMLDRQAQITLDLVDCLRRLAESAPRPPISRSVPRAELFRLDVTKRELESPETSIAPHTKADPEEIWL